MARKDLNDSLDRLSKITQQFGETLRVFNMENHLRLTDNLSKNLSFFSKATELARRQSAVEEVVQRQAAMLKSLEVPIYNQPFALEAMTKQWELLAQITASIKTPEIFQLQQSLLNNDFAALQTFADSLKTPSIEAPNLALLKTASIFSGISLPKGLPSVLKELHVDTAHRLATSESVSFDCLSKTFFVEAQPDDRATVSETNILCSSLHLLSGLDEADLISFLTRLENFPSFASEHPTGRRIREIIESWEPIIGFDQDRYYHARTLSTDACPYTESQMRQAPQGVTWHGRYNHVGQSHYYFSDVPKGTIQEVSKHSKAPRVQIATLQPVKPIRMIDLSQEITTQNKFLEYCRFSSAPDQYPNIKREYLLPCYVASCCELCGIEGIKYYGSKEYKNYVSWHDTYFKILGSEIRSLNN